MSRPAHASVASAPDSVASAFESELAYVCRTFRRLGAQPAEADDLAQEVFIVAWRRWNHYDPARPLRPWLTGIAHNVALEHFRRLRRHEQPSDELEQEDDAPDPEQQLSLARARGLALQALGMLSEQHRSILIQHDLDGTAIREIADGLSLPFFTAASRLRRARARFVRLVKRLQRQDGKYAGLLAVPTLPRSERTGPVARSGPATPALSAPAGRSWPLVFAASAALVVASLIAVFAPRAGTRGAAGQAVDRPSPVAHVARVVQDGAAGRRRAPPRLVTAPASPAAEPQATAVSPEPTAAGLAGGLLAHWRFDDGPGSQVARDSSGRGQPCLLHDLDPDTAWVAGPVGGALDLGRKGWLECPLLDTRLGVPGDLSVAIWFKRQRQRPFSALLARQLPGGDRGHVFWFGLRDDLLTVYGDAWIGWTSRTLIAFDDWIHVAFVHAGGDTRLYVNGVAVRDKSGQWPRGGGLVHSPLTIGGSNRRGDPANARHHFDGLVDEARVYDRALTDVEVAALAKR